VTARADVADIRAQLTAARTQQGASQHDISEAVYLPQSTISQWEQGRRDLTAQSLATLARHLGGRLTIDWAGRDNRPGRCGTIVEINGRMTIFWDDPAAQTVAAVGSSTA
jgi:transcriptional regulator with XRE-family HTH domain